MGVTVRSLFSLVTTPLRFVVDAMRSSTVQAIGDMATVGVCLTTPSALLPTIRISKSAGYVLSASEEVMVPPGVHARIPTGVRVDFSAISPTQSSETATVCVHGRVSPQTELLQRGVYTLTTILDSSDRECIVVDMFNFSKSEVRIKPGEPIALLIFEFHVVPTLTALDPKEWDARMEVSPPSEAPVEKVAANTPEDVV